MYDLTTNRAILPWGMMVSAPAVQIGCAHKTSYTQMNNHAYSYTYIHKCSCIIQLTAQLFGHWLIVTHFLFKISTT